MPTLQRSVAPRGARFFEAGEEVMFVHQLDPSTRDGPRPAEEADRIGHPEAWAAFAATATAGPASPKRKG